MEIAQAAVRLGTEAVKYYRQRPAAESETRVPESALSLFIASELIGHCNIKARVEVPYPRILRELRITGSDVTPKFGGQRADIALYEEELPTALMEVEIIGEGRKLDGVVDDWRKIRLLQEFAQAKGRSVPDGYVAALVCVIAKRTTERAIAELERILGVGGVECGQKVDAQAGGRGWQFMCCRLAT